MKAGPNPGKRVVCTKCGTRRAIEQFQYVATKGRHHSHCKSCQKEAARARREAKKVAAVEAEKKAAAPKARRTRRTREEVAA